jgi:hypothetical protein
VRKLLVLISLGLGLGLAGCSTATDIVAAPFHITADVVRVVPVVGDVVAAPFDVAGNVID